MNGPEPSYDTNVVLYPLSPDPEKADRPEALLAGGGRISVQVLNNFVAVAMRKLAMSWAEIDETLRIVRSVCLVDPLTVETHDRARLVAQATHLAQSGPGSQRCSPLN